MEIRPPPVTDRAAPHGRLTCPRCLSDLRPQPHGLGISWHCPHCQGQSLNFSQFRRMVPERSATAIWETAITRPDTPRRATDCPECAAEMAAVHFTSRHRPGELSVCRTCQRLWLDPLPESHTPTDITLSRPGRRLLPWQAPQNAPPRTAGDVSRDLQRRDDLRRILLLLAAALLLYLIWLSLGKAL